uniref:NADH-ubiquinone oxidoreductase chain 6 n=1 Tax=Quercophylus gonoporospinus TaxID=2127011 RepID=A0A514LNE0_9HEMI|nr:NADH dehydrogenase subunit 6 [Quercophylus gonoporospinus]
MTMIMMMINTMFFFMNHPMSMGLILITQTVTVSIISGLMMKTFWLSYVLVITMLSGMLVLFIYMSSVASNEKFKNKIKLWMLFLIMLMMSMLFLFLNKKMIIKNNYFSMEMMSTKNMEILQLNKMFNSKNMMITIMLVLYLFMTMIASTHLVNISEGPMRLKI